MKIRPGISIKREVPEEVIFIIEDNNVEWIRHDAIEVYCSVPDSWVTEVVAIIIRESCDNPESIEMLGVTTGKSRSEFCKLNDPLERYITVDDARRYINNGKIVYNGSVYKLIG